MEFRHDDETVAGPVSVFSTRWAAQQTLGLAAVRLRGGPLADWQQTNRQTSIPLGIRQLAVAGNLENVRIAAGESTGEFRGPVFMDSDIYKQLEAIAWESGRERLSTEVLAFVRETADLLKRAQHEDGYLNSYYHSSNLGARYTVLASSHEMYCAGHLIQAAVAAHRAGIGDELLEVAVAFADHLVQVFLRDGNPAVDGHPEVEMALVELYRTTGTGAYLELAIQLVDTRGRGEIAANDPHRRGARYLQDHLPVREAESLVGHAVRALYLEAGMVDIYLETGDHHLLDASIRRWEDMVATKTYLTGGLGSRHSHEAFGDAYELPPDRAYAETCAAIASIHWSWRLLIATGDSRYADLIERTLFNGFAGSTSVDGQRFFYVNPLQRRADHYEADDPGRRNEWFSCACCPPNIMRLVASLGHYVAGHTADRISIHQFSSAELTVPLPDGTVEMVMDGDFPWAGRVEVRISRTPAEPWTLAVRNPVWSAKAVILVNGQEIPAAVDEHGYFTVSREWRAGDEVIIDFDLTARLVAPHHRIDAIRGCVAIERGPLVYCLEQVDQSGEDRLDDLVLTNAAAMQVVDRPVIPGVGRSVVIKLSAVRLPAPAGGWPYAEPGLHRYDDLDGSSAAQPTTVTAIPYFQWDNRDGGPMRVWLPMHPIEPPS